MPLKKPNHQITPTEKLFLYALYQQKGSVSEIIQRIINASGSYISPSISAYYPTLTKLEEKKLISSKSEKQKRRVTVFSITKSGKNVVKFFREVDQALLENNH